MEHIFSDYTWWSHEDYHSNNYNILTSDEVYKSFYKTLGSYSNYIDKDERFVELKVIDNCYYFAAETLNINNIHKAIRQWNKELAETGISITDNDIEPIIKDLKMNERRQLIVEKPQGFFEFTTSSHKSRRQKMCQNLSFVYLPKLEDYAE